MKCPTIEDVMLAENDQYQLAKWWRFGTIDTPQDVEAMNLIAVLFKGFTPELSKQIGWKE